MNTLKVGVILIMCLLHVVTTTQLASCKGGTISNNKCTQSCQLNECYCNTTNHAKYDTCNQDCSPPNCFSFGDANKITCIAEKNCSQTCQPGTCAMTCNAQDYCDQKADNNGVKIMSCSSKGCTQSCMEGNCDIMYCEADNCHQTCGKGGCTMNCTESVKMCSQICSSEEKCTLECRAEVSNRSVVALSNVSLWMLHLPTFTFIFHSL